MCVCVRVCMCLCAHSCPCLCTHLYLCFGVSIYVSVVPLCLYIYIYIYIAIHRNAVSLYKTYELLDLGVGSCWDRNPATFMLSIRYLTPDLSSFSA